MADNIAISMSSLSLNQHLIRQPNKRLHPRCGADWINGCTGTGKCGRWKADASLYVPGRWATFVRETGKTYFSVINLILTEHHRSLSAKRFQTPLQRRSSESQIKSGSARSLSTATDVMPAQTPMQLDRPTLSRRVRDASQHCED